MKKLVLILLALLIKNFTYDFENCKSQWSQINTGTTIRLEGLSVVDANTVYFTGFDATMNNAINSKTTNGGLNWFQFAGNNIGGSCVYFLNSNTGFISGFNLCKTTNAGNNWSLAYTSTDTAAILDFHFPNASTGYGVGFVYSNSQILQSVLLKTTNGGSNWNRLASPISGINMELVDVFFTDANTGYTVGWGQSNNILLKTTNGGYNWNSITNSGVGSEAYGVFFTDANNGYVCGQNGIYKTTNAGISWSVSYNYKMNDLYFINANTGFATGGDGIIRTNNAGANWTNQNSTYGDQLLGIMFYGSYNGYAVGKNGLMVKTTNGGSIFVSKISSNVPDKYSLNQNYPNPFNPTTNIRYEISVCHSCESRNPVVTLRIYDALGRELETLVNEKQSPRTYEATFNASQYPSGVYFYRLTTEGFSETKRMMLIK